MNALQIINKYYSRGSLSYRLLLKHSRQVTKKAIQVAKRVPELRPDLTFIEEAGMLHDIGIIFTDAKILGCTGTYPYLAHGYLGRRLLEKEGLKKHALVCERHTGVGITLKEIREQNLPLPKRNLVPITIEEKIICFADKFYTKIPSKSDKEKSIPEIKKDLIKHGKDKVLKFEEWCRLFKEI
ncbi:MAG: HD domain-containing protein [archaeon]